MRTLITILLLIFADKSMAQKKLLIDLTAGILTPIGNNELKTFASGINPFTTQYYHRKRLQHPSINISSGIAYPFSKKLSIGIKSGVYLRFKETYTTYEQRTSVFIPLQLTAQYSLFTINNKWLAINIAAGILFFNFNDFENYHNSLLYNASVSYPIGRKNRIYIGIEKEADRVSLDVNKFNETLLKNETFKYNLNRLFFHISYTFKIRE